MRRARSTEKAVEAGPNGDRLTPRKSFEAWRETVEGRAEKWSRAEIEIAESLRVTLLEIILRLTDEAVTERARAQQQQELLIAELNHRVRNILNLIRGLINMLRGGSGNTSNKLMQARVFLQFIALVLIMLALWYSRSGTPA